MTDERTEFEAAADIKAGVERFMNKERKVLPPVTPNGLIQDLQQRVEALEAGLQWQAAYDGQVRSYHELMKRLIAANDIIAGAHALRCLCEGPHAKDVRCQEIQALAGR